MFLLCSKAMKEEEIRGEQFVFSHQSWWLFNKDDIDSSQIFLKLHLAALSWKFKTLSLIPRCHLFLISDAWKQEAKSNRLVILENAIKFKGYIAKWHSWKAINFLSELLRQYSIKKKTECSGFLCWKLFGELLMKFNFSFPPTSPPTFIQSTRSC